MLVLPWCRADFAGSSSSSIDQLYQSLFRVRSVDLRTKVKGVAAALPAEVPSKLVLMARIWRVTCRSVTPPTFKVPLAGELLAIQLG